MDTPASWQPRTEAGDAATPWLMTTFDLVVIAVVGLSALLALFRGFVREVIALAAWIAALVLAVIYTAPVAAVFVGWHVGPLAAQILAFSAIFIGVLIVGGVIGVFVSGAVRAIGLGWVDRLLGAAFGIARGTVIVIIGILIAGLTDVPRSAAWQNAWLAPPLVAAALQFRDWLPPAWSERLDFSPEGPASSGTGTRVGLPAPSES